MEALDCHVLIIGAGPGGYVCGIRSGQLGLDTIVVEKADLGGTCLNQGCIPSKALIHAADEFHRRVAPNEMGLASTTTTLDFQRTQSWKGSIVQGLGAGVSGLLRKAGVRVVRGTASIVDGKTVVVETAEGPRRISCRELVLATGSRPVELPSLPFGGSVISSSGALALPEVPESLAIVGAGYIGLEIGTAYAKLGARVEVVEAADQILPQYDSALSQPVANRLSALGIDVHLNTKALGVTGHGGLEIESARGSEVLEADRVLVAVGRRPLTEGFGLESLRLTMDGPFVAVDQRGATSMRGVHAIGDVCGEPMLAHRAMAEGVIVAESIAGMSPLSQRRAMPAVCFTDPEIVVVGELPSASSATAVFPFAANGRAMTVERTDGFVRVVYDTETELVLGLQAVGAGVSELAGEFALAIEMAATLRDIADTVHAHPTLGEAVQEVAHLGLGHTLHL